MEAMKDGLGHNAVRRIASALSALADSKRVDGFEFQPKTFIEHAVAPLEALELKQRVLHVIDTLHQFLPADFRQSARLLEALPEVWDRGQDNDPLRGFAAWPLIDYIGEHGLDHPEIALETLRRLTALFSAEFAIRPFILRHPSLCQTTFQQWAKDDCEHVRRLVSEGTRPRLPWGIQLKPYIKDPSDNITWLDTLKNDESLYVRRSVANHLNDISKDHPATVIDLCQSWLSSASEEVKWVIKHATRTLVKAGHPEVFKLLGFTPEPRLKDAKLSARHPEIKLGEALEFDFDIVSDSDEEQSLVIDYAIHFLKANGKQNAKVFKWKKLKLAPHCQLTLSKAHKIKAITTRRYYSGIQRLEILINGRPVADTEFDLQT